MVLRLNWVQRWSEGPSRHIQNFLSRSLQKVCLHPLLQRRRGDWLGRVGRLRGSFFFSASPGWFFWAGSNGLISLSFLAGEGSFFALGGLLPFWLSSTPLRTTRST